MSNLQLFTEPGGDGGGSEGGDGAGAGGNPGNNNNTTMSFDEFWHWKAISQSSTDASRKLSIRL